MTKISDDAAKAAIGAAARELRLPVVRTDAARLAETAQRAGQSHLAYLAEVLSAEVDARSERRQARRIGEARKNSQTSDRQATTVSATFRLRLFETPTTMADIIMRSIKDNNE
ncbi:MAG: hypothetical protein M0Z30_22160 [Actinomycetota bacterium]|nr:hypothetical protein [Actinomycetota bacterium]